MPIPALSRARQVAFEVLLRVETTAAFASDLLHSKLGAQPSLKPEDAALATELTLGVLRWQRRLDHSLNAHTRGKRLDAPVRVALRMGAYQLLMLDRIPAHAAVNESVELVKKEFRSAAGFANAVLRKVAADRAAKRDLPPLSPKASAAERLAIRASHPTWLVERWLARFGEDETAALLATNNAPAPVTFYVDAPETLGVGVELPLESHAERAPWLAGAFHALGKHRDLLSQFEATASAGLLAFQDEASQMVAYLAGVQPGQRVLDVCSAPGGKTLLLARAAGASGSVVACDVHAHRLRAMQSRLAERARFAKEEGFTPAPMAPVHLLALDALQPLPFRVRFDRILVDAPCSGTGTLARNPEIRWRLTPADLQDLHSRQRAILGHALDALAPGGRLVYSTCSLEPEENEHVVEGSLAGHGDCHLAEGRTTLAPHLSHTADPDRLFDARGYFRTLPHVHHTDGFFAAIIEKRALLA